MRKSLYNWKFTCDLDEPLLAITELTAEEFIREGLGD